MAGRLWWETETGLYHEVTKNTKRATDCREGGGRRLQNEKGLTQRRMLTEC